MNYYIVVEGKRTEAKIYPNWIKHLNPNLNQVFSVTDVSSNNFYLVSGYGYPYYLKVIENAILDVNNYPQFDMLVIAVDSESSTLSDKKAEINEIIKDKIDPNKVEIIIQHYCIESWALGNTVIIKRNPEDVVLRKYIRHYNVSHSDPELMETIDSDFFNRAQFSVDYLKRTIREKYHNLTYSKRSPSVVAHKKYFDRLVHRYQTTGHIDSFKRFLDVFSHQNE